MWQMITTMRSDNPPQCSQDTFPPTATSNDRDDKDIWNYGGLLLQNLPETRVYEDQLLRTVARCMGELLRH